MHTALTMTGAPEGESKRRDRHVQVGVVLGIVGLVLVGMVALGNGKGANTPMTGRMALANVAVRQDTVPPSPSTVVDLTAANYDALASNILTKGCPTYEMVIGNMGAAQKWEDKVKCAVDAVAKKVTLVFRAQGRAHFTLFEFVIDKTANTRTLNVKFFTSMNVFVQDHSSWYAAPKFKHKATWKNQMVANPSPSAAAWVNHQSCPDEIGFERGGSVTIYPATRIVCSTNEGVSTGGFQFSLINGDNSRDAYEMSIKPNDAGAGGIYCARYEIPADRVLDLTQNHNVYMNGLNGGHVIAGLPGSPRCTPGDVRFYYSS